MGLALRDHFERRWRRDGQARARGNAMQGPSSGRRLELPASAAPLLRGGAPPAPLRRAQVKYMAALLHVYSRVVKFVEDT